MEPNRERLLQIKAGENRYKQFFIGKDYDHSESIFSLIEETIDQLIKLIYKEASPKELNELLRKRFIKTGWNAFLKDMEYVRPNNPENQLQDALNWSYYNEIGKAIGLDDFESYLKTPKANKKAIQNVWKQCIDRLSMLAEHHEANTASQIEAAFQTCFQNIDTTNQLNFSKKNVLNHFKKLLDEISDLGVSDTEDREVIAEIIQDLLISYGFENSDGLLEEYV